MKGLVLAGGSGKRLRPLTHSGPKQLVPVANRPILHYVIESLVQAGIRDIVVVVSPQTRDEVQQALAGDLGARFQLVLQDAPLGLAHAAKVAEPVLAGSDFCMYLGDNLLGASIRPMVQKFSASQDVDASLLLKEVPNPSAFGVAEVDALGNVVHLVEKPERPRSNLALVGVYLFRSSVFDVIADLTPSARGELEITDAVSGLMRRGKKVCFDRVDGWWLDTGKKDDLIHANEVVLRDRLEPGIEGDVDGETRIEGRVRVEAGAVVRRSVLVGPAIVGAGCRIEDAHVGPFVSVGARTVIERSRIQSTVLLEGGVVRDVPLLSSSVVGRRVIVEASTTPGLSLMVGDDCRVEVTKP